MKMFNRTSAPGALFSGLPLLLLLPLSVAAEVLDELPSQESLWIEGIIFFGASFIAIRWHKIFNILGFLFVIWFIVMALQVFEAWWPIYYRFGVAYYFSAFAMGALTIAGIVLGNIASSRKPKSVKTRS